MSEDAVEGELSRNFLFGSFASVHSLDSAPCASALPAPRPAPGSQPRRLTPDVAALLNIDYEEEQNQDWVSAGGGVSRERRASSTISLGSVAKSLGLPPPPCANPAPQTPQTFLRDILDSCIAPPGQVRPLFSHLGLPPPPTQLLESGQQLEATQRPIPIEAWHSALAVLRMEALLSATARAAAPQQPQRAATPTSAPMQGAEELTAAAKQLYATAQQRAGQERSTARLVATGIVMAEARAAAAAAASGAASAAASGAPSSAAGLSRQPSAAGLGPPPSGTPQQQQQQQQEHRLAPLSAALADKTLAPLVPGASSEEGADPKAAKCDELFHLHARERCKASRLPTLIRAHVLSICRVPRGDAWVPPSLAPPPPPTPSAAAAAAHPPAHPSAHPTATTPALPEYLLPSPPAFLPTALHLTQARAVAAISGNHGAGAKVAVWAALYEILYAPSAALGRRPLPRVVALEGALAVQLSGDALQQPGRGGGGGGAGAAAGVAVNHCGGEGGDGSGIDAPPPHSPSAQPLATLSLRAAIGDLRVFSHRVAKGLSARYKWLDRLEQTPGAGWQGSSVRGGKERPPGTATGGGGGGGGGASGSGSSVGGGGAGGVLRMLPYLRLSVAEAVHAHAYDTLFPLHAAATEAADASAMPCLAKACRLPPSAFDLPSMYDSTGTASAVNASATASTASSAVVGHCCAQEDPLAAALGARVYAPCIEALRFLCAQVTPMSKLGALLAAIRCISLCASAEAALVARVTATSAAASAAAAAEGAAAGGAAPPAAPPTSPTKPRSPMPSLESLSPSKAGGSGGGGGLSPLRESLRREEGALPSAAAAAAGRVGAAQPPKVFTADDVMPRLCFVVAQAWGGGSDGEHAHPLPYRPHAQLSFMEEGIPEEMLHGEEAYYLTALKGALIHVVEVGRGALLTF